MYQACHPERPLEPGDPRYVDLREVRGGRNLARVIYRRIASTEPPDYHQHLITGHRGCGKSTELRQIKGALEDQDLFCVYFDVEEVLDVQNIKYLDVLLAIARVVTERLGEEGMDLPQELLTHLDDWFAEIVLTKEKYEELVVIVDGLEKMPYRFDEEAGQSNHSIFFIQHAEALKKPNCHIVYSVPISLILNNNLADAFPDYEVIPMVSSEDRGREKLREVVRRRISIDDIFESEICVDQIVNVCGGALRDLLRVIRFACDETDDTIGEAEVDRAIQKLVREYDYQVKEEDIATLKEVAEQERLSGSETSARLRHQRLVLEYYDEAGQRYAEVHPAVRRVDRVRWALGDQ